METKACKACSEEKELCEFGKDKYLDDGYMSKCKECKKNKIPIIKDSEKLFKVCDICNKKAKPQAFYKTVIDGNKKTTICKSCKNIQNKIPTNTYKTCTLCKNVKDKIMFSLDSHSADGYSCSCLDCRQKKVRAVEEDITSGFKTCTKCNNTKPLDCYGKNKYVENELLSRCKICINEYNNTPEQREKRKKYREDKKDYMKEYLKKYYKDNKDIYNNSEKIIIKNNLKTCCTCKIEKDITNFSKKRSTKDGYMSRCKKCASIHHQKTKDYSRERRRQRQQNSRRSDPNRRFTDKVRSSIYSALKSKNCSKYKRTLDVLGCTFEDFKKHIESQFLPWMNWDNFGNICGSFPDYNCSWDLDHIIPVSWAKTNEELYMLNHWSNFQPLCSKVNRWEKKGNVPILCNIDLKIITK